MTYFRKIVAFSKCYRWCDLYRNGKFRSYWGIYVDTPFIDNKVEVLEATAIQTWEI